MNQLFKNKIKLIFHFIDKHKRKNKNHNKITTCYYLLNKYVIKLKKRFNYYNYTLQLIKTYNYLMNKQQLKEIKNLQKQLNKQTICQNKYFHQLKKIY